MSELEDKLNQLMSDPKTMEQITSLAKNLGISQPERKEGANPLFGDLDPGMLQKLSGLAGQSSINSEEKGLLQALSPYLNRHRIDKLERAMRAAKMARLATTLLPGITGR